MNTPIQKTNSLKRQLDSSSNDDKYNKKFASAFAYDKDLHTYERAHDDQSIYKHDNASGIYKVNVRNSHNGSINRIGFGKTLHSMNVKNINACKMVSRNTICVHFSKREEANKLTESLQLKNLGYDATIPSYYRTVVGVIKNVPTDITAKEIYDEINDECEIVKVERMTRRLPNGHRGYALNVKIQFALDKLPPHVNIYHGREKVHQYISPVLQCTGCLRYGHHVKACKASGAMNCSRCGSKDHERSQCSMPQPSCIHCKGAHEATSRNCPEKIRQNNIRIIMTGEKLSFKEVIEIYPQYTSKNQFELLENLQNFPPLQRNSYRNELTGKKHNLVSLPQRRNQISARKSPEKYSNHYAENAISTEPTAALTSNQYKVTELEKAASQACLEMRTVTSHSNNDSIGGYSLNESTTSENSIHGESKRSEELLTETENNINNH